jgi:hypothetical protein
MDVERLLGEEIEFVVALPSGARADWNDVVDRAGLQRRQPFARLHRRLAVGVALVSTAAAVALATPARSAIGHIYSDFSDWIAGDPGVSASATDRDIFQAENRKWSAFPQGVRLRRLAELDANGATFTLFGFRAGDTLCLRIRASRQAHETLLSCIPVEQLQQQPSPAVVVAVDYGFAIKDASGASRGVLVTAGIVADGIRSVVLDGTDGVARSALVANDAFISVGSPPLGSRTTRVAAVGANGARFNIPFALAPYGTASTPVASTAPAPGPTALDRHIQDGAIGWLEQRKPVGEPSPPSLPLQRGTVLFRRMVTPDPQAIMRVVVSLMGGTPPISQFLAGKQAVCFALVGLGGAPEGCSPVGMLFERGPFTTAEYVVTGSDQQVALYGLATDDVRRLELYLSDGEILPIPLKDNAYLIGALRSAFPARLVAYDSEENVIGIAMLQSDGISHR